MIKASRFLLRSKPSRLLLLQRLSKTFWQNEPCNTGRMLSKPLKISKPFLETLMSAIPFEDLLWGYLC